MPGFSNAQDQKEYIWPERRSNSRLTDYIRFPSYFFLNRPFFGTMGKLI
ncbi:hypothetical protein NBRC111894_1219 [Sporolactobacillus inulinus]|uniref:Uncharacterized protein n=1 Tax=Sporolactobacillus inulinus TaxID=2078 RepID=A0A4Y1Z9H6_9BACL|nr:hypothetical protein NBRC111894_1219 [Sporolactobacillus inulinus]